MMGLYKRKLSLPLRVKVLVCVSYLGLIDTVGQIVTPPA